jgi:hypothetical protein
MAEKKPLLVYAAAYETVEAALADLDAIEQAHKDEVIGQYDAGQGACHGRQSREAHRGGHDPRNHQRAAGSAQELTLPQQPKAALSGDAFLVEVAQHRRLKR